MSSDLDDQWLYGGSSGEVLLEDIIFPFEVGDFFFFFFAEDVQSPVKVKTEPVIKENGNGTLPTPDRLALFLLAKNFHYCTTESLICVVCFI